MFAFALVSWCACSLLRFLIDMRGEDTSSKQLRDDLMTMLIAGTETDVMHYTIEQQPEWHSTSTRTLESLLSSSRVLRLYQLRTA